MPHQQLKQIILEYWDVPDENREAFHSYYREVIIPSLGHVPGYLSTTTLTKRPGGAHATSGARKAVTPHRGMSQAGQRTNFMIDFDALLEHEYNVLNIHYLVSDPTFAELGDQFTSGWEQVNPSWRDENPGVEDPWDVLARDFFSLCSNHWDVVLDVADVHVETVAA